MSQHIGAPAKALVKKGDEVFVGTKIGEAGGFVSANIHSSVSGTVTAVEPFRLSNGRMCDSVVIKTDGKQTVDPAVKAPEVTDKASFLAAVRECGLVGLGGAGFPTDVKLQPKQTVDTLLINASECEVWLTSDTQEMLNCSDDIVRGIEAVLKYTGIPKCVIGIENNKPESIDLLCKKTNGDSTIEVKPLPSVYGTGAELDDRCHDSNHHTVDQSSDCFTVCKKQCKIRKRKLTRSIGKCIIQQDQYWTDDKND